MEILIGKEITSIWAEFYWRLSTSFFMQGAQLNFMNKNLKKWRILNFLSLLLKRHWKSMGIKFLKCVGTLKLAYGQPSQVAPKNICKQPVDG